MDADEEWLTQSVFATAVAGMSPGSRLKLLQVVDSLVMHLMKSELPAPPNPPGPAEHTATAEGDASDDSEQQALAVPLTPVEDTAILNPKLGVLRIDYDYPPAVGDTAHPGSFAYPVMYERVAGLTFELCQAGDLSDHPTVVRNFDAAVERLHRAGCDVVTGDCGFMFQFQQDFAFIESRPSMVLLSPLSQLATLISGLAPTKKVAIMTANSSTFDNMLKLLKHQEEKSGVTPEYSVSRAPRDRYVVVGCQDVPHFGREVAKGEAVEYALAEPGIVALAQKTLRDHREVDLLLLECTELPQFANTLRFKTGKPVYTAITLANMAMAGRQSNPRFGRWEWKVAFEKQEEERAKRAHPQQQGRPEKPQDTLVFKAATGYSLPAGNSSPAGWADTAIIGDAASEEEEEADEAHVLDVLGKLAAL